MPASNNGFASMLGINPAGGLLGAFPPAPQPGGGGLLDALRQLFGGRNGPMLPEAQVGETPAAEMTPMKRLLAPEVGLPMAAALLQQGKGNWSNLSDAFSAAAPGLKRNKTLEMLRTKAPDLAQMVDMGLEPKDAMALWYERQKTGQKAPDVETFYDDQGRAYKGQWNAKTGAWDKVGGSKGDEGFEVTLPDGTTVRQGAFGSQDRKNMANRINDEQEASKAASSLKSTVAMLRKANQNTGYSGVGGGVYGAVDDAAEQFGFGDYLPGNAGARATMRSGGLDVALANVQKTKGAISNAEMDLFMAASPGMQNTPEGNAALLDILDAVADRQIMRTREAEKWRAQNGMLDGFEAAWGQYVESNPLLAEDGNGSVRLAQGGGAPAGGARRTSNGLPWSVRP